MGAATYGQGHLNVVELLMKDTRVNPADQRNEAIILASMKGHLAIVKRLMEDVRVDPSDQDNTPILFGCTQLSCRRC